MFTTTHKLTIDAIKIYFDLMWRSGSAQDVKFFILFNMMFVFIKNSITQCVQDSVKNDNAKWIRTGGVDGALLMIIVHIKNAHGA